MTSKGKVGAAMNSDEQMKMLAECIRVAYPGDTI